MDVFSLDDLLSGYPPPIVSTVDRLRQRIRLVNDDVAEKANHGWRSISYSDPQLGYFCGIFPFENHVDLVFEFGILLDDPGGILQGDSKQTRFLRFHEPGEVQSETVMHFLKAALNLPASHTLRRELIRARHNSRSGKS